MAKKSPKIARSVDPMEAHSVGELLPWLYSTGIAHDKVVCKDDSILGVWALRGVDIESADPSTLEAAASQMDDVLRRLASSGVNVWTLMERRPAGGYKFGSFDNEVAGYIDELWGATFAESPLYENRCFIAVAMPTRGAALSLGEAVGQGISSGRGMLSSVADALKARVRGSKLTGFRTKEELDRMCARFETHIAQIVDSSLHECTVTRLRGPDLLGFLKSTVSANRLAPVGVNEDEYLDTYLSDTFIDNSYQDHLILDGTKRQYVGVYSLKAAPGGNLLAGLNSLTALPMRIRIGITWRSATIAQADKFLAGARSFDEMRGFTPRKLIKKMMARDAAVDGDDTPQTRVGSIAEDFRQMNKRNQASFGWMAASVCVYADSPEVLNDNMDLVQRNLERSGMVFIRERDGSLSGFCVGVPGHLREVVRWHFVEASNLTDMVPMITLDSGKDYHPFFSEGLPERLPPCATLRTRYNTVQYFNYHVGQLGHALLIGPSRNGKTMFQMFLTSQFLKYPNARVFILDKDLSCKPPTLLMGGRYIDLDPNRGGGMKLNPLSVAGTESGATWFSSWLDELLQARGPALTDKELQEVYEATLRIRDFPGKRLTTLMTQLSEGLRARLQPWCEGGAYGMFFDHAEDDFEFGRITATEVGSLINAGLLDVVRGYTSYAFYRIEQFLSNSDPREIGPTLVYFEEAGFLLDSPIFAARAKDYLMTLAKKNAFLVMTAQSPEPFINQPDLGAAVRDNIATILFLPNKGASRADLGKKYREAFGVNDVQLELIADATPRQEYCIFQPANDTFRVAQAHFPPEIVACLRSDKKSISIFNNFYDEGDPEWKQKYLHAVLNA